MCGIHVQLLAATSSPAQLDLHPDCERRLRNRGPDHIRSLEVSLEARQPAASLRITSTVLSLRGDHVARQPLVDESTGSVLCWNGEAWRLRGQRVEGNDGEAILVQLALAKEERYILHVLRAIEGPFAFVYLAKHLNKLFYGRDRLGRRSLLNKAGDTFAVASVADEPSASWREVEADGCYVIDLGEARPISQLSPARLEWAQGENMVANIGSFNSCLPSGPHSLDQNSRSVVLLRQHLATSVRTRVVNIPLPASAGQTDARVAVLFSGGLDCTLLARLASEYVPVEQPIDLINVAFENPRLASQAKDRTQEELFELCPDRITGRQAFRELTSVCPNRKWRFVTANVPYVETCEHRTEVIRLMHPHNTEMDISIANALYFAARGKGNSQCQPDEAPQPYETKARVLLSGLGADELFGGYTRHSTSFSRRGYGGLIEELLLDVSRLGQRNLGRDDRVMAHWGREVRFPYLDEVFVKWAIELPVWEKCDFANGVDSEIRIEPGKRLLRLLAAELGMDLVAREKKRAIQFGARTAKMESGRVKGTAPVTT